MKTSPSHRALLLTVTVVGLAALSLVPVSATAKDNGARRPLMIAKLADRDAVAADALAATTEAWQNIQYYTYEKRADFTAIFTRMFGQLDEQIRVLNAKRANMTNDTKAWDFAMKELNNARADVQSKLTDLSKATTPETWVEARDRLGVAWERAQDAVKAVKTSTTS